MSSWWRKQSTKATTTGTSFCCTGWRLPSEIVFRWMRLMMKMLWTLWRQGRGYFAYTQNATSNPRAHDIHDRWNLVSSYWVLPTPQEAFNETNHAWIFSRNSTKKHSGKCHIVLHVMERLLGVFTEFAVLHKSKSINGWFPHTSPTMSPRNSPWRTTLSLCGIHINPHHHFSYESNNNDVVKWKHFLCYCPFVWGINRSPVNCPH